MRWVRALGVQSASACVNLCVVYNLCTVYIQYAVHVDVSWLPRPPGWKTASRRGSEGRYEALEDRLRWVRALGVQSASTHTLTTSLKAGLAQLQVSRCGCARVPVSWASSVLEELCKAQGVFLAHGVGSWLPLARRRRGHN